MYFLFDYSSFIGLTDTFNQTENLLMATTKAAAAAAKKAAAKKGTTAPVTAAAAPAAVAPASLLKTIVDATRSEAGFIYAAKTDDLAALVTAGHVEVREDIVDENGAIAARATATGAAVADATPAAAPVASPFGATASAAFTPAAAPVAAAPVAAAPVAATVVVPAPAAPAASSFALIGGVPIPAAKRFGKSSTYPFDSMEVGQSFFVAATQDRPNPAKSMASTVNSAKARYAVEDGVDAEGNTKYRNTREFVLRRVQDGTPFGFPGKEGAGIWRTK